MPTPWDMMQQTLLLWLALKDRGVRRDRCDSAQLAKLIEQGLVKVRPERVRLTALGWAQVTRIQERMRANEQHREAGDG